MSNDQKKRLEQSIDNAIKRRQLMEQDARRAEASRRAQILLPFAPFFSMVGDLREIAARRAWGSVESQDDTQAMAGTVTITNGSRGTTREITWRTDGTVLVVGWGGREGEDTYRPSNLDPATDRLESIATSVLSDG